MSLCALRSVDRPRNKPAAEEQASPVLQGCPNWRAMQSQKKKGIGETDSANTRPYLLEVRPYIKLPGELKQQLKYVWVPAHFGFHPPGVLPLRKWLDLLAF